MLYGTTGVQCNVVCASHLVIEVICVSRGWRRKNAMKWVVLELIPLLTMAAYSGEHLPADTGSPFP